MVRLYSTALSSAVRGQLRTCDHPVPASHAPYGRAIGPQIVPQGRFRLVSPKSQNKPICRAFLIGETGFEPATARPPAGCATRLRHSPWCTLDSTARGEPPSSAVPSSGDPSLALACRARSSFRGPTRVAKAVGRTNRARCEKGASDVDMDAMETLPHEGHGVSTHRCVATVAWFAQPRLEAGHCGEPRGSA